jgi:hypothetical protein
MIIMAGEMIEAMKNRMATITPNIERIEVFFTNFFIEPLPERTKHA